MIVNQILILFRKVQFIYWLFYFKKESLEIYH